MFQDSPVSPESRLKRLQQLSQVTREMMSDLASLTLDELLGRIARHAVEILDAETCGVFLVRGDELSLEAGFGHREGGFVKGRRLKIRGGAGNGLTGFIAFERKKGPFNLHGEDLARHPAVAGLELSHTPSGSCHSLLAINLFHKREGREDLIGLLRVDNKKGEDGRSSPALRFGPEDEWILTLFADAAVVAIENAELVSQLKEQEGFKERLIASSPDGIIAVDQDGRVTAYNPQAAEILGYTPVEVLGRPVDRLYDDPGEPRRIGRMLHQGGGRLRDHETTVRSHSDEKIPVRHSSTWLFDAAGQRVGSVGYFEDLRRRRLLLEASNLLTTADHLDAGLQQLADLMVKQLGRSICGILLTDESGEAMILRAASTLRPLWRPRRGERFRLADWPGLRELLARGRPAIRSRGQEAACPNLDRLSHVLACERPIQSLLVVPFTLEGRVVGQIDLGVLAGDPGGSFTREERHLVSAIASQVTALIDRMNLQEANRQTFRQLAVLHRIGDYIQATDDLEKILHTILTGVTASYGLGFNRSVLMLLDDAENCLVGQCGIGEIDEEQARAAWRLDATEGLDSFDHYLERLERGALAVTTVDRWVRELQIAIGGDDPFSEAMRSRRPVRVAPPDFDRLPAEFREALQPTTPLLIVPLATKQRVLGALAVDNKFTNAQIGEGLLSSLMIFVDTAAVVLENKRLFQETLSGREKLLSYYQDSGELLALRDPEQILRTLIEQTYRVSGAWGVSILLIDAKGRIQSPIQFGKDRELRPDDTQLVRPYGISQEVMRTGEAVRIPDVGKERGRVVNPFLAQRGIRAALCLPLSLPGQRIGVMWIHYQRPRPLSDFEVGALQLYVNRAATAYAEARRMRRLEAFREAVDLLAGAGGTEDVLRQIAVSARRALEAEGSVLWLYDANARGEHFLPDRSVASGIDDAAWERFRNSGPRPRGTAYRVMGRGWIAVGDTEDAEESKPLGETTRRFLSEVGSRAFLGVALKAGQERLGALYALYDRPRVFEEEDEKRARTFANHAALTLKKAKLLDQLQKTKAAAKSVARLTVLGGRGGRQATLERIARETRQALDCGAVVLFEVDPATGRLNHPPTMVGVNHPERAYREEEIEDYGLVDEILERSTPLVVPRVPDDPLFQKTRFAREEEIKSCVAIPLQAPDRKVGVMFVNYRSFRRFTEEDVETIEMFADQAAVALQNAQLLEERTRLAEEETRQLEVRRKLIGFWRQLLATNSYHEILDRAVAFAAEALRTEFANIVLKESDGRLICRASYGWDPPLVGVEMPGENGSQTSYTINRGGPVRVDNFQEVSDFEVPKVVLDHDIRCGLSTPMFRDDGTIPGAMLVHSQRWWRFTNEDETLLGLIAKDTAFALQLLETRSLVIARTTLAVMGLSESHWGHQLSRHAVKAHREVQALRRELEAHDRERIEHHLQEIEKWADLTNVLVPSRHELDLDSPFLINEQLIRGVVARLWEIEPYRNFTYDLSLGLDEAARARGSYRWLSVALGLLVDNAIDAIEDTEEKLIGFGSRKNGTRAEVLVTDRGRGFPKTLWGAFQGGALPPSPGGNGLGVGLTAVQIILQTCKGELLWEEAQSGTSVILSLPLA